MRASRKLILAAALLIPGALLSGCYIDHRREIAYATLFDDGWPNQAAFERALSARFPAGSSMQSVQAFAHRNGGECKAKSDSQMRCEITTRAMFCAASWLQIDVSLEDKKVRTLTVKAMGAGC